MRNVTLACVALASAAGGVLIGIGAVRLVSAEQARPDGFRIYEMRTYHTHPGKLDALHARFRDHTNYLFVKHGMTLIGYWTPVDTDDTLVYLLAYPDMESRERSWRAFMNDPEWKKAFQDSRREGPIVRQVENHFLVPTDYSPAR